MFFESKNLKVQLDNFDIPKTITQFISSDTLDNININDNAEFILRSDGYKYQYFDKTLLISFDPEWYGKIKFLAIESFDYDYSKRILKFKINKECFNLEIQPTINEFVNIEIPEFIKFDKSEDALSFHLYSIGVNVIDKISLLLKTSNIKYLYLDEVGMSYDRATRNINFECVVDTILNFIDNHIYCGESMNKAMRKCNNPLGLYTYINTCKGLITRLFRKKLVRKPDERYGKYKRIFQ